MDIGINPSFPYTDSPTLTVSPWRGARPWRRLQFLPLFVLASLLWLCAAHAAQAEPLSLSPTDGTAAAVPLSAHVTAVRAPVGELDPARVVAGEHAQRFTAPPDGTALACSGGNECWLRVALSGTAAWDGWLRLRAVHPGDVRLHTPAACAVPGVATADGVQVPQTFALNWRFLSTEQFFPIQLHRGAPCTFYLQVRDTRSVDGIQALHHTGFERQQRQMGIYMGISLGVAIALMVLNLVYWRWLREPLFGWLALLMLAASLMSLWQIVPSLALPAEVGSLALRAALQALMQAAVTMLIIRLFDLRRHLPWLSHGMHAVVALNLALGVLALAGLHAEIATAQAVLHLAGMAGSAAAAVWLLVGRHRAQYFWVALIMLLLAVRSGMGRLEWLGVMDIGPDRDAGLASLVVWLSYMLLLTIMVANRTRRAKLALNETHHRALNASVAAERALEDDVQRHGAELALSNERLAREIEARREAEDGLAAAQRSEREALAQQRQFVSMVSHEFRTPLAVIDAAAQSMGLPDVETAPRVDRIRRAVRRLNLLVINCLADERLHGQQRLESNAVELRGLIDTVLSHFCSPGRERLFVHAPDEPLRVRGDATLLDVCLHNMIQNALKYSSQDRAVDVHLYRLLGDEVAIEVRDQGPGIDADEQPRIFERFYRGHSARLAQSPSGTGLGLYIGAEIARAHGGSLTLSQSDASGSTFRLNLPIDSGMPGPAG